MRMALRSALALTGGLVAVAASVTTATAAPAQVGGSSTAASSNAVSPSTVNQKPDVVHSCSQTVAKNHATCFALRRADLGFTTRHQLAITPNATPSGYGPSSLQSAYKLPSSTAGSGKRVFIVDAYDDPNAESDLAAYRTQFGLPACTTANGCFKKVNQTGGTTYPTADTGWAGEISLDLDMVSAICPNCGITLVEANDASDNLYTAVKEAVTLGAKYVSLSWGGSEFSSETTYDTNYFSGPGVVYTVSTGDSAYSGGREYPATSSKVVAVGGTALTTASNARGWNETVWKTSSTEGAGSGCSAYVARPSWQSVVGSACSRRADADVSAVADPATGVAVYQTYGGSGWAVYGGTSASAPIIASVYALAGTPASTDQPASFPYAHTGNLNDVTTGNNGTCSPALLCTAATGWDGPTGLGTPNGVAAFAPGGTTTGNTVTVTNPGSRTGTVGTAASLQIQATDSAGAALTYSATGLPAGLTINASSGLISGTPTTAGTSSVTVTAKDSTNASGSTTFSWTINPAGTTGCAAPGQKLANPGFETTGGWTASSGVLTTDGAHSRTGTGYAYLDGYGTTHTDTLSQTVSVPANCTATFTYYLSIATSETTTTTAYDKITVTANGTTIGTFSNLNKGAYAAHTVNLSSYAGTSVTLKFSATEDSSLQTSFFVDDTSVTAG